MLRAKLGDSLSSFGQVTNEADSGPLFHSVVADCRFNHGLEAAQFPESPPGGPRLCRPGTVPAAERINGPEIVVNISNQFFVLE